jgi:hypothetical protein
MMVNACVVNGGASYFMPRQTCEFFRAFASIPRSQNPFKYIRKSRINRFRAPRER